nr:unnamed protein product [Callosobruchus analis]
MLFGGYKRTTVSCICGFIDGLVKGDYQGSYYLFSFSVVETPASPSAAVFPACPAAAVEGAGLEKVCSSSSRASSAFSGRQAWPPPLQEPPLSLPPPGDPPPTGERPGSPPIETDPIRTPYTDGSSGA